MRRKRAMNVWGEQQSHWQVTQSHPLLRPGGLSFQIWKAKGLGSCSQQAKGLQPAQHLLSLATTTKPLHAWGGQQMPDTGWGANTELDFGCFFTTGLRRPQDTTQLWSSLPHFSSNHCFRAGGMNLMPQQLLQEWTRCKYIQAASCECPGS